jgi:beta-galactosidase
MIFKISFLLLLICFAFSAELPTLYEHYTSGGIKSGLKAEGSHFTLNGKEITIFGGEFHYFRVHHQKWREVLLKFKAAGLNAVIILIYIYIYFIVESKFF